MNTKWFVLWWFLILLHFFLEATGVSINAQFPGHTQPTPAQKIRLFLVCSWSTQGATEDPICAVRVWVCVCVLWGHSWLIEWSDTYASDVTAPLKLLHVTLLKNVLAKFAFNFFEHGIDAHFKSWSCKHAVAPVLLISASVALIIWCPLCPLNNKCHLQCVLLPEVKFADYI